MQDGNQITYFVAGEPLNLLRGQGSTAGLGYFSRGEPYKGIFQAPAASTMAYPVFPGATRRPLRAAVQAYSIIVCPTADLPVSGRPSFPGNVRAPSRASSQAYSIVVSPASSAVVSGRPVFPDSVSRIRRATGEAYFVLAQPSPVAVSTASPVWPTVPVRRRLAPRQAYAVSVFAAPVPPINLGRYRLGDVVSISCQGAGQVTAVISGPPGSQSSLVPTRDGLNYHWSVMLDSWFSLGAYSVAIGGSVYLFEVVPGGDAEGPVVSLFQQKSVNGWLTIIHTQAGDLVLGRGGRT